MLFVLLAASLSSAMSSGSAADVSHRAEWEAWRKSRLEELRQDDGWLTLVGLFWLEEGDNPFGTDPANRIVFPAGKALSRMGSIRLDKGALTAIVDPRVDVTHDGKSVTQLALQTDASADSPPTILKHGTLSFYVIRRGDRFGVRVKDSQAQARQQFRGVPTFPYDEHFRIEARWEPSDPPRMISVPTVLGTVESEPSPGDLVFEWKGRSYRLEPVGEKGETDLFVIFGDTTSGHETYGGGRFLYAAAPVGGKTILDFNKAFNPPCVFTPYATCPLPPKQNHLPFRVEAGEKEYEP